jgi:hypothetical protein
MIKTEILPLEGAQWYEFLIYPFFMGVYTFNLYGVMTFSGIGDLVLSFTTFVYTKWIWDN